MISKFAVISMVAMMPCFVEADKMVMGIIAGNTVNVRTAPSAKSASKCVLPIGADVYIQRYEKDERVIDGKKGRWAFVETDIVEKGLDTYSGWVFDYYILSNKKIGATGFEEVIELGLKTKEVTFTINMNTEEAEEYIITLRNDGSFKSQMRSSYKNGESEGRIYKYRSLYFAESSTGYMQFYIRNDTELVVLSSMLYSASPTSIKLLSSPRVSEVK